MLSWPSSLYFIISFSNIRLSLSCSHCSWAILLRNFHIFRPHCIMIDANCPFHIVIFLVILTLRSCRYCSCAWPHILLTLPYNRCFWPISFCCSRVSCTVTECWSITGLYEPPHTMCLIACLIAGEVLIVSSSLPNCRQMSSWLFLGKKNICSLSSLSSLHMGH